MPNLLNVWGRLKKDYGALYFLTLLFRNIQGLSSYEKDLVIDLLFYCLSDNWPLSIKFRSSAIISLMKINSCLCKNYIDKWLDSDLNPYWPCRYATLISLDNNTDGNNLNIFIDSLRNSLNDSNRLVKLKAQEIFSRRFSLGKNFL